MFRICVVVIILVFAANAAGQVLDFDAPHHPSRVLVKFHAGTLQSARQGAHEGAGTLQVLEEYPAFEGLQLVEVADGTVDAAVKAYLGDPNVRYAEPDYDRYPTAVCNPNDLNLVTANTLWGLKKVRAPEAWCLTTGNQDFPVAVIDSGIMWGHPDLNANIWTNPQECPGGMGTCQPGNVNGDGCPGICGIDDDGDGKVDEDSAGHQPGQPGYTNDLANDDDENGYVDDFYGWDFLNNRNIVLETSLDQWHGTRVAGTIGAVGNNGVGIVGMNWRIKLVALKIMPSAGPTQASHVIAAMNYCIQKNIKVSNNSYLGDGQSVFECEAIQNAGNLIGHIFVAASGNGGLDLDVTPRYPASCGKAQTGCAVCPITNIITVTATNQDDDRGCMKWNPAPPACPPTCIAYANYGYQTVHLGAPGSGESAGVPCPQTLGGIYSTIYDENGPAYGHLAGTSFAAPHVTGAVALVWARYPSWTYNQVRNLILNTVKKGSLDFQTMTGGRLDIGAALLDCNRNGVADGIDVNTHSSLDCNDNNIPDECDEVGACCLPEGGCLDCVSESECDEENGFWSPFAECIQCAMFAPPGP